MSTDQTDDRIYVDANGCLTERIRVGGQDIVVHYDDLPESDITIVHGLRCTTPIRTVIDIAPELPSPDLERIIRDCLDRGLFTVEEALARIDQPDMAARVGAHMVTADGAPYGAPSHRAQDGVRQRAAVIARPSAGIRAPNIRRSPSLTGS